jgi:hypothetical protein
VAALLEEKGFLLDVTPAARTWLGEMDMTPISVPARLSAPSNVNCKTLWPSKYCWDFKPGETILVDKGENGLTLHQWCSQRTIETICNRRQDRTSNE